MSAFLNQQLTNVGWDALSIALGGGRLTFYKMQAGQGTIANDAAIPAMTSLVTPICDIAITSYIYEGDGQITLFGNIASRDLPTGFTFRELGVFATIEPPTGRGGMPSGPNITAITATPGTTTTPVVPPPAEGTALMYSYCNSYTASDYIPGSGESTDVVNTVQVTIKIDRAEDVQINILAGETFSVVNIGPPSVGAGVWSHTDANVAYLKRLVAGAQTLISEDANTITIGQKQLTSDLDLYVANGNPDISPNFSSIQKALDYLGQYVIPTTVRARIHVSPGTYVSTTQIQCYHPNGSSITIQGPQNTTVQGSSLSITGSANNWNVTIGGLSSTTQFVVNDWAIISYVGGTTSLNHPLATGFFKVLSKTASSVTVRIPNPKASFSMTGTSMILITPISVILTTSTLNVPILTIGPAGIGMIQYIGAIPTVVPTLSMGMINFAGTSYARYLGVAGFNTPLNAQYDNVVHGINSGAAVNLYACASTNNQNGIAGSGNVSYTFEQCVCTYNKHIGFWVEQGNAIFIKPTCFTGGNNYGIMVSTGANVIIWASVPAAYVMSMCNELWGCVAQAGASLSFSTAACTLYAQNNGLSQATHYDVIVTNYGLVNGSVGIQGSRIFNSAVGVINSTGGLIN